MKECILHLTPVQVVGPAITVWRDTAQDSPDAAGLGFRVNGWPVTDAVLTGLYHWLVLGAKP